MHRRAEGIACPRGFFRGLLGSFLEGYRGARSARGAVDGAETITWTGATLVRVGAPDGALVGRVASRLSALLVTEVDVHPTALGLHAPDRDGHDGPQWDAEVVRDALDELAAPPRCLLGVTEVDLFARDLSFVFGFGHEGVGLLSYQRFLDDLEGEPAELLDERVTKQALSSIGAALGVDRCEDESCVRAYPNCLAEHDRKQLRACPSCREAFERALGHRVEL